MPKDFERIALPVSLENTDEKQKMGNKTFQTTDIVFLDADDEIIDLSSQSRQTSITDYAIANGGFEYWEGVAPTGKKGTSSYWLRSAYSKNVVNTVDEGGDRYSNGSSSTQLGLRPALHLNLSSIISARSASREFKIVTVKNKNGDVLYHTLELGQYPKTKAANTDEIEKQFKNGKVRATGKTYTGYRQEDGSFAKNEEYEYNGQKYVRVKVNRFEDGNFFADGKRVPPSGEFVWFKVEPITWRIRNWDEMPREINPNGNGRAKFADVISEESIMSGIPFYPDYGETEHTMWQNSPIRAYLNGYDLHKEIAIGKGNKNYKASENFNFEGHGFLQEAGLNAEMVASVAQNDETQQQGLTAEPERRKSRLERLNPDKTPLSARRKMTDTEIIKSWIDAGQSVLLRGPSGIGKTERLKTLYPNLIYIKLTNNMFPEKVVGSMNLQTGAAIPPDFAKEALLSCATEEERKLVEENIQYLYKIADDIYERSKSSTEKIVILLDELLNVKPAVQSLVYTLVLNKLVETGKGLKLPANTVVVATGNQKKYSSVAEDLAEPLEKRFDHILDMEPKVGAWIYEYAIPHKIHPSVIGYIFSKYQQAGQSEAISDMGYFYEEPEVGEQHLDENGCRGRTNDPRGWVSISNSLYAFEEDLAKGKLVGKDVEDLLKKSIASKLRVEWAEEFFDFYNHPTITVEEIVEKRYTQADLPMDINEKFACIAGLLSADEKQVGACRRFIREYCDPEYLSVYDLYWAGNDESRMEKIAELQELDKDTLQNQPVKLESPRQEQDIKDLSKLLIATELDNTDENQKMGDRKFKTTDAVFLDSYDDIKDLSDEERQTTATDYAVMNGALLGNKTTKYTWYWLRSAYSKYYVLSVNRDGDRGPHSSDRTQLGLRPILHLNLSYFISARSESHDFGKVILSGGKYTIEFGEYPKSHAENEDELERLFQNGSLKRTGKKYTGFMKDDGSFSMNEEFEYGGKRYVRVVCKRYDEDSHFADGKKEPENGGISWAVVEPITWEIRNWEDLPKEINPKGTGKAKYIDVQTEEGILSGIPFYPEYGDEKGRDTMWQNSVIRAYLNGYDLHREIDRGNGNKAYKNDKNFNFEGHGFLQEAGIIQSLIDTKKIDGGRTK